MRSKAKTIIRGIGSLMDVFPRPEFSRHIPRKNTNERMDEHWQRVGESFRRVMVDFHHEIADGQRSSESAK